MTSQISRVQPAFHQQAPGFGETGLTLGWRHLLLRRVDPGFLSTVGIYAGERTNQVPDRAALTLVVLAPENEAGDPATTRLMETMLREHGSSSRTYKSALLWCVAEDGALLSEEARKVLAWEDIDAESQTLRIDESQRRQLDENLKRAKRDLQEAVWRTYKNVFLLDETNALRKIDLGLVHSSRGCAVISSQPINPGVLMKPMFGSRAAGATCIAPLIPPVPPSTSCCQRYAMPRRPNGCFARLSAIHRIRIPASSTPIRHASTARRFQQ